MKTVPVLTECKGLNVRIDPVRTAGTGFLSSCKNVEIDDSGRVSRRKGFSQFVTGEWHSLFAAGRYMLGVTEDALSVIYGDGSYVRIANVQTGLRMSYALVWDGQREVVYFGNGVESGKVVGGVAYHLVYSEPQGNVTRSLEVMPALTHLTLWNGRLYGVENEIVWYSEPLNFEVIDKSRNYWAFESRVLGLMPIKTGMVVGLENDIVLLKGSSPAEVVRSNLSSGRGMVEWSEVLMGSGGFIPLKEGFILWEPWLIGTKGGVGAISQDGVFSDLGRDVIAFPGDVAKGAGCVMNNEKFVLTLEG